MTEKKVRRAEKLQDGNFIRTTTAGLPRAVENIALAIPVGEVMLYSSRTDRPVMIKTSLSVPAESADEGREKLRWKKGKLVVGQPVAGRVEIDGRNERGLDGLTESFLRGNSFASVDHGDQLWVSLGEGEKLDINGEPYELGENEEELLEVPYITRRVEIGIPEDAQITTDLRVPRGKVEVAGITGEGIVRTSTAAVDIIDHQGRMTVDTYGSPITVVDFSGHITVKGSFIGGDYPRVAVDGFSGSADIYLAWSGDGSILLREGTDLGSLSNTHHVSPEVVPHGIPFKERPARTATSSRLRTVEIKRVKGRGGVSSYRYAW